MGRSEARAAAMQLLYEAMLGGQGGEDTKLELLSLDMSDEDETYIDGLVTEALSRQPALDAEIEKYLVNWTLERLSRVDLAILRLAALEILHRDDVPDSVAINEAVELSHTFSTDEAGPFINGVLGSLARGK